MQDQEELVRDLEATRKELEAAQAQLIHSEKMASLGQLMAGIAHEIKNPLNFVNNFAMILGELVEEIGEILSERPDAKISDLSEDLEALMDDVKVTTEKIREHGKRADSIVRNMLQHSRGTEGMRLPTNINDLLKEYVNLSYHGLRANDPEFNSDYETQLDETVGDVEVVPQDIGRVFLNLLNNAFYAVSDRAKSASREYDPVVRVTSERNNGRIRITVSDNGGGVPADLVDDIFQPFFTTKPTGEGTGLGLPMSHDIVEQHGGSLDLENVAGEGATFVVDLPG
ncbi:MAG: ATP-binding protein [Rhodothermales bacterium]